MGITVGVRPARRPPRLGPRQRDRADRHRRRRHGHAARAVPRHLPRRDRVGDADHRGALRGRRRWSRSSPASGRRAPILRRIARESLPVLVLAGTIDVIAGLTIEKRFESFLVYPALLVLVPPFLEDSGALGGILTARVSTKLHLGTLEPGSGEPARGRADDILLVYIYAIPVFFLLGVSADIAALVVGSKSPGSLEMIAVSMLAGADRDDVRGARRLLRRGRRVPARARSRQPRDPDRHVEPRPARRGRADPGDRRARLDLSATSLSSGARRRTRACASTRRWPSPRRSSVNRHA